MSGMDKLRNTAQDLTGKGKEHAGRATGDEELENEGHADQAEGSLKQAGENIKDAFR